MNKMTIIIFSTMAALLTQDAGAAGKTQGRSSTTANTKPWMKCIVVVNGNAVGNPTTATTTTTVAPTPMPTSASTSATQTPTAGSYGISFTLEPNNGNYISADTFSLNGQGQKIKQVGHAEVLSTNSPGNSGSSAVILQNSPDSPFQLSVSLNTPASGSTPTSPASIATSTTTTTNVPQTVTGTLTSVTLFNGQIISQLPLVCRLSLTADQQEGSAL